MSALSPTPVAGAAPALRARPGSRGLELLENGVPVDVFAVYHREPVLRVALGAAVFASPHAPLLARDAGPLDLRILREPHRPPAQARMAPALARLAADPRRFDGTLVSLRSLERRGGRWEGCLRPVSYFEARAAESLLDRDGLRAQECRQGRLPAIGAGALAGDMGVVVLLRTADCQYVLQRRGPSLDWRPGRLSVTASGSLEPGPDLIGDQLGVPDLLRGAARELEEEVGVGSDVGLDLRFLGIWRELARGGKPEIYATGTVQCAAAAVLAQQASARDAHEAAEVQVVPVPQTEAALIELVYGLLPDADPALILALLLDGQLRGLGRRLP